MDEPVRLGIIGCGVIGTKHIQMATRSGRIDLVAIADLQPALLEQRARQYSVPAAYASAEDLLADPAVEAVVLAMPACFRTELAFQALDAGKHLLTEKPVAMNASEVRSLMAAQGDRVVACCSARFQFLEATRAVTTFVATGALGALRTLRCRAIVPAGPPPTSPPPIWRLRRDLNGGGILSNWGCYDFDYLLGISGWSLQPQTILAQTWRVAEAFSAYAAPNSDAETHVSAMIRCAGGTVITYERAEFLAAERQTEWQLIGEHGSLSLQMTPAEASTMVHFNADVEHGLHRQSIWQGSADYDATHQGVLDDFADAIRQERPPQTDLQRALVIQRLTDAIYRSAERGEAVRFDET